MRLVCPTCSAIYEVPDALLADGKRTRCARCAGEWVPQPAGAPSAPLPPTPQVVPAPVIATPPAPAVAPRTARPADVTRETRHRPAGRRMAHTLAVSIALGASILVLAGLCAAMMVWRAALIDIFPPAERVFLWLGLG